MTRDSRPTASQDAVRPPETARRVVMLVGNAVIPDNRVRKTAKVLADSGYDVTLIGLATHTKPHDVVTEELDGYTVLHVPVTFSEREYARPAAYRAATRAHLALDGRRAKALNQHNAVLQRVEIGDAVIDSSLRSGIHKQLAGLGHSARLGARRLNKHVLRLRRRLGRPNADGSPKLVPRIQARLDLTHWASHPYIQFPETLDYERVFGPVIDRLEFDYLHAHDVYMVGVGARAVARRRAAGHSVGFIYDAHEFTPGLTYYAAPRVKAMRRHEARYIRYADIVTTVSEPIADKMREVYGLAATPWVVRNTPEFASHYRTVSPTMRERLGLGPDAQLVVYSGAVGNMRGEETLIRAMEHLPSSVHAVLVTNAAPKRLEMYANIADDLGVVGRVHTMPYVLPEDVVPFLKDADVGFFGLLRGPANYEMALPNKMYEYMHAGLPLVVSQARALRAFVESNEIGVSFEAGNPEDAADKIAAVLADRERFLSHLEDDSDLLKQYCWEQDSRTILECYDRLRQETTS